MQVDKEILLKYLNQHNDKYFTQYKFHEITEINESDNYFSFRAKVSNQLEFINGGEIYMDGGYIKEYKEFGQEIREKKLKRILE